MEMNERAGTLRAIRRAASSYALLVVAALVAGCGVLPERDGPNDAAQQWVVALLDFDGAALSERTCDARQGELKAGSALLTGLALVSQYALGGIRPTVRVTKQSFSTTEHRSDRATVRFAGTIKVSVALLSEEVDVDESMSMKREGGRWKFCP